MALRQPYVLEKIDTIELSLADSPYVVPKLQGTEVYWDAAINRAIVAASANNKKVLLNRFYDVNGSINLLSNTIIEGVNTNCGINAHHLGAVIKKDSSQSSIFNCTLDNFKIGSYDDNAIFIDMDNVTNSIIRNIIDYNSYGQTYRKNKIGIRFINGCYYNSIEDCHLGGFHTAILFDITSDTGSNENNVIRGSLPFNDIGIQINSLSNRETNMIKVKDVSMENNTLAINCNGKYCYFINNRYENCTQAIKLDTMSANCLVNGGNFYTTTIPYQDLGQDNNIINVVADQYYPVPLLKYDNAFNYLVGADFTTIDNNVPYGWVLDSPLTTSIDTSFVSGLRLLKITIPSATNGTYSLLQHLSGSLLSSMVGKKYLKAVVYCDSSEITTLKMSSNGSTGLSQSGNHSRSGWGALQTSMTTTSVPTWCDVMLSITCNTTAIRNVYIAFIGLTDYSIIGTEVGTPPMYVNKFGDMIYNDLTFSANGKGIVLRSPDGTKYRITVANGGALSTTVVT